MVPPAVRLDDSEVHVWDDGEGGPVAGELAALARRVAEEVTNQGDGAVATELLAPDVLLRVPGREPVVGLPAVVGWLSALRRATPDFHVVVEEQLTSGEMVAQRLLARGAQLATLVVDVQHFGPRGLVVEWWTSLDAYGSQSR